MYQHNLLLANAQFVNRQIKMAELTNGF